MVDRAREAGEAQGGTAMARERDRAEVVANELGDYLRSEQEGSNWQERNLLDGHAKGMYARALAGEIRQFTGIDDPYEAPLYPQVRVDTDIQTPSESLQAILGALIDAGHIQVLGI